MGCVYIAYCADSGKAYVGMTTKLMVQRLVEHTLAAEDGSDWIFHRAIRAHGIEAFKFCELFTSDDRDELWAKEKENIARYGTMAPNGYNGSGGGHGGACGPEGLAKISAKLKGRAMTWGDKISKTLKGRPAPKPPGHGANVSKANKGKKKSAEHCANVSRAKKDKKLPKHSEETKRKISRSNKLFALRQVAKKLLDLEKELSDE